jgi:hypothetical protein
MYDRVLVLAHIPVLLKPLLYKDHNDPFDASLSSEIHLEDAKK